MNVSTRTALVSRMFAAAMFSGKLLQTKNLSNREVRAMGRQFLTPRTHSNANRNKASRQRGVARRHAALLQRRYDREAQR